VISTDDVIGILDALDAAAVVVWIDGGWGVDALLKRERRGHDDLDAAIAFEDLPRAEEALASLGFARDESQAQWFPARIVLSDARGRQVDLHPLHFDAEGNGVQQMPEWVDVPEGVYPADGLRGRGRIGGRDIRCLTPELQLAHHVYANHDDVDYEDVLAVCERFRLTVPHEYARRPGWVDSRRSIEFRP
jgi:lincosamide nucleotidyltransferase A/C/D/E